ncbi:MAG: hydrogenase maturation protein [Xanthomonadales bacterium]|nr:hydrogenase maturation protein [Xanthomonadales bacterium]
MRILILCHAFNSLSQRVFAELERAGHEVSVELDISDEVTREAVALFEPDAVVAPFLKRRIPDDVWQAVPCLIVHPGPPGDRGPNALDWAVLDAPETWGVSIILATAELDGGPVLASRGFAMRPARKSSLYRLEVTEAAVQALFEALERLDKDPRPAGDGGDAPVEDRWRDAVPGDLRRIDWTRDDTETVLRKINSADGQPGVVDVIEAVTADREFRLFDARPENELSGPPGDLLARSGGAVCRATADGAVWIGHIRDPAGKDFKRPAVDVLGDAADALEEIPPDWTERETRRGPIRYVEHGDVGMLAFDFYNGAMSTRDCEALLAAWRYAAARPTRVIVLTGGRDFWSNGMDLNSIEAAESPADESWRNINAMDDLAEAVIDTTSHLTVSAMAGNAAAGGVFLALAADRVWARDGIVLNPHYKNMGNLYGSEYWTYLLPRRVGESGVEQVMGHRLPMLADRAQQLGLVDAVGPNRTAEFDEFVARRARALALDDWHEEIDAKSKARAADEALRALASYRKAELDRMHLNFFGFDPSYHVARYRLVHRTPHAWTPLHLARHRSIARAEAGTEPDR